jgi:hypothetical protein
LFLNRLPCKPTPAFTSTILKKLNMDSIAVLDATTSNVAGSIYFSKEEGFRHCVLPGAIPDRKDRVNILRWLTGGVAQHIKCKNCPGQVDMSRRHALSCSGADDWLRDQCGHLVSATDYPNLNLLDRLLNKFRLDPPMADFYKILSHAISLIYSNCLQYQQQDNGFWQAPPADPVGGGAPNQVPHGGTPPHRQDQPATMVATNSTTQARSQGAHLLVHHAISRNGVG